MAWIYAEDKWFQVNTVGVSWMVTMPWLRGEIGEWGNCGCGGNRRCDPKIEKKTPF
jgi:hypothetical protein